MVRFSAFVVGMLTLACSTFAASPDAPPAVAGDHSILLSAEHSLIVYAVGIVISFGTAVMIKLLSSALRAARGASTEQG